MKIEELSDESKTYTSNVYLITGNWNSMDDINTLIDVGRDESIIRRIQDASTGVGKKRIEQVILTHSHYDHMELLPEIKKLFSPVIHAFSRDISGVDNIIKNGDKLRCGDRIFEVIHTPGHSSDSICLYNSEEKVIFAGDTPLIIRSVDNSYEKDFIEALEYIGSLDIETIYFGHGKPLKGNCNKTIKNSLNLLKNGTTHGFAD